MSPLSRKQLNSVWLRILACLRPPLPLYSPSTEIEYVADDVDVGPAIARLLSTHPDHVGFDIESRWRDGRIAVFQFSTSERTVVIHHSRMTEKIRERNLSKAVREILVNPDIEKVGVNIRGDAKQLHRQYNVDTHACVELSYVARSLHSRVWPERVSFWTRLLHPKWWLVAPMGKFFDTIGLVKLVAHYLSAALDKTEQRSNWGEPLTAGQIRYAASDSDAANLIYLELRNDPRFAQIPPITYSFDMVDGSPEFDGRPWPLPKFNPL
ncbi:ribonuclease H-like domain-containing protein [Phellopilus nigrolimitatus]|nr:ribonuclease H-like domain-containing protein [Phellopilus nigrolimitatus]